MRNIPTGKTRGKKIPRAKAAATKKKTTATVLAAATPTILQDRPPRPALPLLMTYRAAARRAGLIFRYAETEYCGEDGVWVACWNDPAEPLFARVGIVRTGDEEVITYGTASRHEHRPYIFGSDGLVPDPEWVHFAITRLAEIAEIAAIEKACPEAFAAAETDGHRVAVVQSERSIDANGKPIKVGDVVTGTDEVISSGFPAGGHVVAVVGEAIILQWFDAKGDEHFEGIHAYRYIVNRKGAANA